MNGKDSLWSLLGTEQGKLLAGFLLTTLLGGVLAYLFQALSWKRQAKLDLFQQRYKEGTEFLERLSGLIDRRYFGLQRFFWAIESNATAAKRATREREYFQTVVEWNHNLRSAHNRVRILIGEKEALAFLDYGDDFRPDDDPQSLHYKFVKAHKYVTAAKSDPSLVPEAKRAVDQLNWALSGFLYDVTTLFTQRAGSLSLLKPPRESATSKIGQISGPPLVGPDGERLPGPASTEGPESRSTRP